MVTIAEATVMIITMHAQVCILCLPLQLFSEELCVASVGVKHEFYYDTFDGARMVRAYWRATRGCLHYTYVDRRVACFVDKLRERIQHVDVHRQEEGPEE